MRSPWISLALLIALIFGSCSSSPPVTSDSPSLAPTNGQLEKKPAEVSSLNSSEKSVQSINTPDFTGMTPLPADTNQFVILVKQDLADRLKINTDQITFLKITEITWPDITQGCGPTPGETLSKGRLTGYRIWLQANAENYAYHVGIDGQIFMCPK